MTGSAKSGILALRYCSRIAPSGGASRRPVGFIRATGLKRARRLPINPVAVQLINYPRFGQAALVLARSGLRGDILVGDGF